MAHMANETATKLNEMPLPRLIEPKCKAEDGRSSLDARHWITVIAMLITLLVLLAALGRLWYLMNAFGATSAIGCDPNASLWFPVEYARQQTAWEPKYLLAITVGWGKLNFATAKALDVAWDFVIGRGWQAITGWTVYNVYRRYWSTRLRKENCNMAVETAMALQYDTTTFTGFMTYARVMRKPLLHKWPLRKSTIVLMLCVVYVLLTPTWLSTMSGYVAISTPVMRLNDTTSIDPTDMVRLDYMIVDGDRVGLERNTALTFSDRPGLSEYYDEYYALERKPRSVSTVRIRKDTMRSNFTSDGKFYELNAPPLDIREAQDVVLRYDDLLYDLQSLEDRSVCQPNNDYRWGFSYQLAFGFLLVTEMLGIALFCFWIHDAVYSTDRPADNIFGSLRTAVLVSEAVCERIGDEGVGASNEELVTAVRSRAIRVSLPESSLNAKSTAVDLPNGTRTEFA